MYNSNFRSKTQNIINNAFNLAENGWHEFFSSGIPIGSESLYRTYSDNVAYLVPNPATLEIYLVYDYDKERILTDYNILKEKIFNQQQTERFQKYIDDTYKGAVITSFIDAK